MTDPRVELASLAASLRAYLEWQKDTGATGIPRAPRRAAPSVAAAAPAPAVVAPAPAPAPAAPALPRAPTTLEQPDWAASSAKVPVQKVSATAAPVVVVTPAGPPRALDVIAAEVASCTKCELAKTRTNTVFSRGNPEAKLCFVGEAPGADEDEQGLPFVGRAGQLLDRMIVAMGLDPAKDVYVCNIIKCRPPGNRKPTPEESETCIPYLHEQLAAVAPKVFVAMGNTAVAALLGTKLGITKVRGEWKLYRGRVLLMPTYHPSYLLRPSAQQPQAKREAWEDLQKVMKELGIAAPPPKGAT
jgi:uracil-DNA glycosylase family 4